MPLILEGKTDGSNLSIGIVVAKWNSFITEKLCEGAVDALTNNGVDSDNIIIAKCPGAYEILFTAKQLLPKVDGIVAIGAVIRGDTPHFKYVCEAVNNGITGLNTSSDKAVTFGVLTTDNVEQAKERSGLKGNKGAEASLALLEMIDVASQIKQL